MTALVIDTESTTFQRGNPFARRNRLCYVGALRETGALTIGDATVLPDVGHEIANSTCLVGFNLKFDLHWLRREGHPVENRRVWCCQTARYLLEAQRVQWWDNSLDEACRVYGIAGKLGDVAEYWDSGVDTPDIPRATMLAYLEQDLRATLGVYQAQRARFYRQPKLYTLFQLAMKDLLVLADMEYNGLKFNTEVAAKDAQDVKGKLEAIDKELRNHCPNTPVNFDSGDDLSAYLYGGNIVRERREPVGLFKTGAKVGLPRYKVVEDTYTLPRLVEPLKGSHMKKGDEEKGPWKTADDVLKEVKQVKQVKLLQERAKLTKLLESLVGLPELILEKDWEPDRLHGQFQQNRVRTGRLSSSDPNLQNMPDEILKLVETRYVESTEKTATPS
jgi:DNA polymerase I-like protein with 3'-5' exonuclease and polymerase domains